MGVRIKRQLHMIAYINRQTGLMLNRIPDQVFHIVRKNKHLCTSAKYRSGRLKRPSRPDRSTLPAIADDEQTERCVAFFFFKYDGQAATLARRRKPEKDAKTSRPIRPGGQKAFCEEAHPPLWVSVFPFSTSMGERPYALGYWAADAACS